jgi:hypothetical protein
MSGLGDEIAALRASLVEMRVGVARRWAARRGAALPGSLETSVRRLGLRALDAAARRDASTGRQRRPWRAAHGGEPARRSVRTRWVALWPWLLVVGGGCALGLGLWLRLSR